MEDMARHIPRCNREYAIYTCNRVIKVIQWCKREYTFYVIVLLKSQTIKSRVK